MKKLTVNYVLLLILIHLTGHAAANQSEDVYVQACYVCHGDDGSGSMPGVPDLRNSKTLFTEQEEIIVTRLKAGITVPGGISMPPGGGNPDLTDDELLNVLRYVKQLVKNN